MRAIAYHDDGSPDVLRCEETEKPTPGEDEVLIKGSRRCGESDGLALQGRDPAVRESDVDAICDEIQQARPDHREELLEAGTVTPVIDTTYLLGEADEAIRYLEAGHARGKVVITP